jgi:hypothetical protein
LSSAPPADCLEEPQPTNEAANTTPETNETNFFIVS